MMIEDFSLPLVRLSPGTAVSNHFASSITASYRAFIRMNFIWSFERTDVHAGTTDIVRST